MQHSPYGHLPLFMLYKMQWSGLGCLGGGGLVSTKLIFVSQEVMTAVAPARKGEE